MDFHPKPPRIVIPPEQVGTDTWLVHQVQEAEGAPLRVYVNSLVIAGAEPVLVDTGTLGNRQQWIDDTFSIVDPDDVRYIFISHDDADHTGNLAEALAMCPNATLLASWALAERMASAIDMPLHRSRWVGHGDRLDLADRRLSFVRPPVYDSPTTRGLFDHHTGVYWAADAFATPCTPALEATVEELDPEFWQGGIAMFAHNAIAPWLQIVDEDRYRTTVREVRELGMTTIASAHAPVVTDRSIDTAFDMVRALPRVPAPPAPDQHALEAIVAEITASA